jgi:hypothetical protein
VHLLDDALVPQPQAEHLCSSGGLLGCPHMGGMELIQFNIMGEWFCFSPAELMEPLGHWLMGTVEKIKKRSQHEQPRYADMNR